MVVVREKQWWGGVLKEYRMFKYTNWFAELWKFWSGVALYYEWFMVRNGVGGCFDEFIHQNSKEINEN